MNNPQETQETDNILDRLAPISQIMTEEQKRELLQCIEIRKYKKNEVIYSEGDVPQYFHCLIRGKVKIFKEGVGGRNQIVHLLKPVEYFGYRAYLANENYITSSAAFEPAVICLIPVQIFEKWLNSNPKLSAYFIQLFATEMGVLNRHVVSLTQKHLRGRLAESLLFLKDTFGVERDGQTLSAKLSRADLGDLSNMTTSNAIRTLSAFCEEGILEVNGRDIKILDEETLKKINRIG